MEALGDPGRLEALASFGPADAYRGSNADRIVRLLARQLDGPIATAAFVFPDRLLHFARYGDAEMETPLDQFPPGTDLSVAVVEQGGTLVVEDMQAHPVFSANPFVCGPPGIRFFAGVPLRADSGHIIGVLCLLDLKPRTLTADEVAFLEDMGALAEDELRLTRQAWELRQTQTRMAELLEATNSSFFDYDFARRRVTRIGAMRKILGLPEGMEPPTEADELAKLIHTDDLGHLQQAFLHALDARNTFEVDFRLRRPDGSYRSVRMRGSFLWDAQGRPLRAVGTVSDTTTREEAERQVRESEHRYRVLSELVKSFAYAYELPSDGGLPRMAWVTDSVREVLGWVPEEAIGQPWGRDIDPRDQGLMLERLASARRGENRVDDLRIIDSAGAVRWLRLVMHPEVNARTGQVGRVYGAGVDVTAYKEGEIALVLAKEQAEEAQQRAEQAQARAEQAQQKAEEMSRLKDAFLANMSHEIRTPLTSVLGFAELLRDEVEDDHLEYVEVIAASARRLKDTLTSVLELSQLQSGGITLRPEAGDLGPLIEESVRLLSPQAWEKGLTLHVDLAASLEGCLDRRALGRVLTNLLGNAVKFTNSGTITTRGRVEGGEIVLEVQDTGIGMAPEFLDHVFDDFRQESQGMARTYEGNGLGLAICKRLVSLMDGTIRVASEPHVGSTFTVRFPQALPRAAPPSAPGLRPGAAPTQVLVVEDDAATRLLLSSYLRRYRLQAVGTADEALQLAAQPGQHFDVVLLDINLGEGGSGEVLLPQLRATPCGREARYIAMTAYSLPGDRERFMENGFDDYVSKPFVLRDLLAAVGTPARG